MKETFLKHLSFVSKSLGMDEIVPDDNGTCTVAFGKTIQRFFVTISYDEEKDEAEFRTSVWMPDKVDEEDILKRFLAENLFWLHDGIIKAIEPNLGSIALIERFSINDLSKKDFAVNLFAFVRETSRVIALLSNTADEQGNALDSEIEKCKDAPACKSESFTDLLNFAMRV